ncbi:MAG: HAMP domain-containing sensor histidine kinase [Gemmatimonadota bacterium]|nr:HAMP domain-containing sensor histidine kinase [Gemmatimonadota bacterium]
MALGTTAALGCLIGYVTLQSTLYNRLDDLVLRLASIEAAATADSPDESVHFHDAEYAAGPVSSDSLLERYAEVWTTAGRPVIQTTNLAGRHLPVPDAVRQHVVATEAPELFTLVFGGGHYRSVLYPLGLIGPQHQAHLLQVATSTRETDTILDRVAGFLTLLALGGFALGGALGWWLAGYAVRPVLAIIREAEQMDAVGRGHRIVVEADATELQRLVAVLNGLLRRLDGVLDSQRRFLADAGHAIKTPLTILRGDIDVALRKERAPDEYRRVLGQTLTDLRDTSALADDLITLAHTDGEPRATVGARVDVQDVLATVHRRFGPAAARAGASLIMEAQPGPLEARIDGALLERALSNIVDNAVKYSGATRIVLAAATTPDNAVSLLIQDDGCGISPGEQGRVFDRFYRGTAGRARAGSGLGLAIALAAVSSAAGSIVIDSDVGTGTTVRIVLERPIDDAGR